MKITIKNRIDKITFINICKDNDLSVEEKEDNTLEVEPCKKNQTLTIDQ